MLIIRAHDYLFAHIHKIDMDTRYPCIPRIHQSAYVQLMLFEQPFILKSTRYSYDTIASEQSRSPTAYSQAFPTGRQPATIQGQVTICHWSGMTPSETRAPTRLAPWCPLRQPFGRNDPHTNKVATKHRELGDSLEVSWASYATSKNRLQQACA
jgi:hypothetical protein